MQHRDELRAPLQHAIKVLQGSSRQSISLPMNHAPISAGASAQCLQVSSHFAGEGISAEDNGPNAMFKLSALKGPQAAAQVGQTAAPDEEDAAAEAASTDSDDSASASDEDSDEATR